MTGIFRSFNSYNYRLWTAGAFISNVGTWMQRIAQTWLVLTQLSHHDATALGAVMGFQLGPHFVLLPWTGYVIDHVNRRRFLIVTQAALATLALLQGMLTITGQIQLWHIYIFALLLGCITAFDTPARQVFISELVGTENLSNAVALNSTSFNAARMIGPAVGASAIAAAGCGCAFLINSASFLAVLGTLAVIRNSALHRDPVTEDRSRGLLDGFRYVWMHGDLKTTLVMLFMIGTFGLNFEIFISTMAVSVFHVGVGQYGFLMSILAVGTISGSLVAAKQDSPDMKHLLYGAAVFGIGCALAAAATSYTLFAIALIVIGAAALIFTTGTNSLMQLSAEPGMRGRVMAIRLAVGIGCTPLGAPIVGWVADACGPRWAMGLASVSGLLAAAVAARYLSKRAPIQGTAAPGN